MNEYKISPLIVGRARSETRMSLQAQIHHQSERLRKLHAFLDAFSEYFGGGKKTKKRLKRLKEAYNEIYPMCGAHRVGEFCECPWTEPGWIINNIKVK